MPGHAAGVQRASTSCLCMDLCVTDAAEGSEGVSWLSLPLETIPDNQSQFDQHALLEKAKMGETREISPAWKISAARSALQLEKWCRDTRSCAQKQMLEVNWY